MSTISNIHETYGHFESWFYDRVIAEGSLPIKIELLQEQMRDLPIGARVLDLGCGGGQVIEALCKLRPDFRWTAVDNSPLQIEKAKSRLASVASEIQFVEASALALPFVDENFDFVLSLASLKHWPDQTKGLKESLRVLKRGGVLLVTELDRGSTSEQVREFVGRWKIPSLLKRPVSRLYEDRIIKNSLRAEDVLSLLRPMDVGALASFPFPKTPAFVITTRRANA